MTQQEWLRKISWQEESDKSKDLCSRPHVLDIKRMPWTAATDGKICVFLRGAVPGVLQDSPKAAKTLPPLFEPLGKAAWVGTVEALRAWCGLAVWTEPCPACKGTSAKSEYVSCSFCDSDGIIQGQERPGRLLGALIDCNLLARALEGVTGGVTVHMPEVKVTADSKHEAALWFIGDGWRAVLMPIVEDGERMRHDEEWAEAVKNAPHFPVKP